MPKQMVFKKRHLRNKQPDAQNNIGITEWNWDTATVKNINWVFARKNFWGAAVLVLYMVSLTAMNCSASYLNPTSIFELAPSALLKEPVWWTQTSWQIYSRTGLLIKHSDHSHFQSESKQQLKRGSLVFVYYRSVRVAITLSSLGRTDDKTPTLY